MSRGGVEVVGAGRCVAGSVTTRFVAWRRLLDVGVLHLGLVGLV